MNLVPITLRAAKAFVDEHHRHNSSPRGWKFGVGLEIDGQLIGVGIAGRPVARMLDDGTTLEITRVCTLGAKNANSMIYGALIRAGKALGYQRFVTYTLPEESGSSLAAVGFQKMGKSAGGEWSRPSRLREGSKKVGYEVGEKVRWELSSPDVSRETRTDVR